MDINKPGKTGKKGKNKSSKNGGTNGGNGKVPIALGNSSKVDRLGGSGSLLHETVPEAPGHSSPVHRAVQTDRILVSERWVMTDPLPPVESFKERYESVLHEKIDLRAKLEESEDRRFKLQRDHKRELDRLNKTLRQEAKEVRQSVCRARAILVHRGISELRHQSKEPALLYSYIHRPIEWLPLLAVE